MHYQHSSRARYLNQMFKCDKFYKSFNANPLQCNLLYYAARFANLEQILGFSVPSIMHFSEGEVNVTHM